jgi:hypothetical protein
VAAVLALVAGDDDVELELLLPQPAASTDTPTAMNVAELRRIEAEPTKTTSSLLARQNPGTLPESWQHRGSLRCANGDWNAG